VSDGINLENLLQEIASERGVDFRGYKRSTLERRFRKRMSDVKAPSYAEYSQYLRSHADEVNELLNTVLINVTEFFRDRPAWEVLRREVIPRLLEGREPGDSVRCWSAGCASGEEPYSLAILLAEYFGPRLSEYDVKIYGTDIDEDALTLARRGEYAPEQLQRIRPEWRKKYFQGDKTLRVNRELRRLCIFGRSNVISDAPISHVDLLLCRNLLIYCDGPTQTKILTRLHYALEPHGVLFIGKASSLVGASHLFRAVNSKYRIFQRADTPMDQRTQSDDAAKQADLKVRERDRDELPQLHQAALLETLDSGVLLLDARDTVTRENDAVRHLWGIKDSLLGKPIGETELGSRCPDLSVHLEQTRTKDEVVRFQCSTGSSPRSQTLSVILKPVMSSAGARAGTLVYMEDTSSREKLQTTIEELEATGEELQSANEELETTNEELQSANEELETTNEELQSTNEEMETTNEELQSLNEELQTANEELATRSKEMDELNSRYVETLERMPWPVMVVSERLKIEFWNSPAQNLFGFNANPPSELRLEQLPVPAPFRARLIKRHRTTLARKTRNLLRDELLEGPKSRKILNVHFTPLSSDGAPQSVLIMFEITGTHDLVSGGRAGSNSSGKSRSAKNRGKKPAARKTKAGRSRRK
jgi:two-component system CheB/CheR fusion protein